MIMLLFLLVLPFSLYAAFPGFSLGLFGDDWIAIWKYFYALGPESLGLWSYLTHLFTAYGSFNLIMGLLVSMVGYQSVYFYITAYFLKLFSALSFYPLVYYFTRSKLAAFFSVLFFSVTAVGLDTTTWVFNMPVYIAIACLNLFLLYFIKSRIENNYKLFMLGLVFFAVAVLIASVRMTGVVPFVILIESFWLIRDHNFKSIKLSSIRVLVFLSLFYSIVMLGQFVASVGGYTDLLVSSPKYWSSLWEGGLVTATSYLSQGKFSFIFNPLIVIGNIALPIDPSSGRQLLLLITGVLILVVGIYFIVANLKNRLISTGLFLSLAWLILSFIIGWIRDPINILPFSHRYLIVSAQGFTIFLAIIMGMRKSLSQRRVVFAAFLLLVILNIFSSRGYLMYLVDNLRGRQTAEKIWSKMPYIPNMSKISQPLVFYFVGESGSILYGSITFGFPYHMALLYNLDHYLKMPIAMGNWDQIVSAVTDGKSFAPYGHPLKPIPLENVFAFRLEGKDNLINITDEVRNKLSKLK